MKCNKVPPEDILAGQTSYISGSLSPPKTATQGTLVYTTRNALDAKDPGDATNRGPREDPLDLCLCGRIGEHHMQHMQYAKCK